MARQPEAFVRDLWPEEAQRLVQITRRTRDRIRLRRAGIVLASLQGRSASEAAAMFAATPAYARAGHPPPYRYHRAAVKCRVLACKPHQCKPMSASTVRQIHFIISGALTTAVRWEWLPSNPAATTKEAASAAAAAEAAQLSRGGTRSSRPRLPAPRHLTVVTDAATPAVLRVPDPGIAVTTHRALLAALLDIS